MLRLVIALLLCISFTFSYATETPSDTSATEYTEAEMIAMYEAYMDSLMATIEYHSGTVDVRNGLATLKLPEQFKYVGPEQGEMILTDMWGNPPSGSDACLGMIFPEGLGPDFEEEDGYAINITYSEDGYVDDADARDIDYDELLSDMQEGTIAENDERIAAGYDPIELIGWASAPYYDEVAKKLHWAKELRFGESEVNTLNYNVRVLGRKGYLELNVIGDMASLERAKADIPTIISSVAFNQGYRYEDFDSSIDKVAAYGIGGLIAGKVLAKAGILAKLGVFFAKAWKLILIALVAVGSGLKRMFGKKKEEKYPAA